MAYLTHAYLDKLAAKLEKLKSTIEKAGEVKEDHQVVE